ncbi:class I SAM-dependent methyltransferase [Shewanella sp. JNE10-2]|uniref:class I SAM-dependent methyltransferase n=1 Tax=unclassified Shewanella TaxID=196818 RepID=UPI002005EB2E|nr:MULTISPECIES: class I SAM-dependent methyltransferase [unclassified Shewanella]MCK7628767.1 class I SAM-dependent methyltransferase [Shewanella sp. JNE9-1]MCK7644016.1 class I SAM-dependent methyltransferase [Shewanella sp. JNE3-1]MCK7652070.1 class I SAM-dependent methyltransferase [Shewanella sp. JNE4-1]UPO26096.1 class I SAM-dependent methyltransferase [Shewanella sp. JNE10-2]UPO37082.1 class I SAM-dependent methyltransferase [Shewanella sp. JNE7]
MTIQYYNDNADIFFAGTINVDMSELHKKFTSHLLEGALILDGGCGSGRDSLAFMQQGFRVEAFDAAEAMVAKASALTGLDVQLKRFDQLEETERYDGIWTCASLLHVPKVNLLESMKALANSLKQGGVWYLSFKYGDSERIKDGRKFTDLNEQSLLSMLSELVGLEIHETWVTVDKRLDRDEKWLNAIIKK